MKFLSYDGLLYFCQKIKALLAGKVDKVDGKGLSTNDYTTAEKTKLAGLMNYIHPTTSGNKHIPAGGSANQILGWSADGTAKWVNEKDTTYSVMSGATVDADGKSGLVPSPTKGAQRWLDSTGAWTTPPNTTYGAASTTSAGLMSAADKKKLDGVADGANKYVHPATSGNKHIPVGGSDGMILGWSADGTAKWVADKDTTYDACTEWVSLTASSVYTVKSGITMWANTEKAHRRGRRVYLTFQCMGPATSDAAGFIQIGTVQSAYRPKVNAYCPFGLNVTTSGQIFGPAVCIIKTTGEIQVYTGKNNATFGNNSYGWTTNNPNTISWDY